jgi:hypothetical protein
MRGYALVVGHGRSGTNWLLDLLDASSETFCRNEPDEIPGSPLARLEAPWIRCERDAAFAAAFDAAVQWTATHLGERDRRVYVPKRHLHASSARLGLQNVYLRRRVREALRRVLPAMRPGEWPLPRWLGDAEALERALAVIKLTQAPGWACWVLEQRPQARVIHIVRHPGGFLNSWRNRYLASRDEQAVRAANARRLALVIAADPGWGPRLGDLDAMSVSESELWYWLYACEVIEQSGLGRPGYQRLLYEELTAAPLERAREVYRTCGLEWSEDVARSIGATTGQSQHIAGAWRDRVSRADVDLIERVLAGSVIEGWWGDD